MSTHTPQDNTAQHPSPAITTGTAADLIPIDGPQAAVAWLEDPATLVHKLGEATRTAPSWNAPMFILKEHDDCGPAMTIGPCAYDDPDLWWL